MRNLEGIRDPLALQAFEYGAVAWRHRQLRSDPSIVERTFDAEHVRAIHQYLFQDVYEWAGQYRSVNMTKSLSSFADVHTGQIDRYLSDVHCLVGAADWAGLDRDAFARASAEVFSYLNQAHPFREGNGRTSKVFMEHVAELSEFSLDFAQVSPQVWNQASMLSGPDLGRYEPVPDSLVPVFQAIARPARRF
ncbi:Fic family protein [Schaalia sp. 19OD2882]|uniref:Fic/DOC family protein n=1 Tax=Schaalia sp. 19OD2882 TaxID=2794089 RepID=UPI001C1EAFEA|nr:Fic family protein [Schaalia sp. 19OD2882]QWW19459.1 Fic family protein [Schaalia sp. 19OD2882]